MKRILRFMFFSGFGLLLALASCDVFVEKVASENVYASVTEIPSKKAALVLGTSYKQRSGRVNPYFMHRVRAAVELYKAGKVEYIIVSGDNSRSEYDESTDMKNVLVSMGVPANRIFLDFAGFRTLDSVVRCKAIFDQNDVIIVSQKFHNERAVFLAKAKDMKAIGYNATDVKGRFGLRVHLREKLARLKAVIDIAINTQPKFLGPKIELKHG